MVVGIAQGQIQDVTAYVLLQFPGGINGNFRQSTAIDFLANRYAEFGKIRNGIQAVHAQTLNSTTGYPAVETRHKQDIVLIDQWLSRTNAKLPGNFQIGCFISQNLLVALVCATAAWEFNQPEFFYLLVG